MQITIIVSDQLVACDNIPVHLPGLDWAKFDMDPNDPNDNVSAVQFNTSTGQGHVEFETQITKQSNRPNKRPPDWHIGQAEFDANFAWVLPHYTAEKSKLEEAAALARQQEEAAREAAAANEAEARRLRIAKASVPQSGEEPLPDLATASELEVLKAKIAELEARANRTEIIVKDVIVEGAKAGGEGT